MGPLSPLGFSVEGPFPILRSPWAKRLGGDSGRRKAMSPNASNRFIKTFSCRFSAHDALPTINLHGYIMGNRLQRFVAGVEAIGVFRHVVENKSLIGEGLHVLTRLCGRGRHSGNDALWICLADFGNGAR